ncbi:MAG: 1-acyl-sn-glycerol-3-phosphate acyltransferase [Chloroflexi bacterium]|nr:1-acyl-sn-glycerol-3-phosphate acyltransferase [Chloroflexota bacterium]
MRAIRWISVKVIWLATKILLKVKAEGLERIPRSGPVILAVNHINFIDPLLIYAISPRPVIGLAKHELWANPLTRLIAKSWGTIPVRRGELDLHAMRHALQTLQEGGVLGLAPEGTRSHHGRLQQARSGIVLLALRAPDALILPMAVYGQEQFFKNLRHLRRTEVHVVTGRGFYLDPGDMKITHEVRQEIADAIMYQIAALLPPEYRGVYQNMAATPGRYLRFVDEQQ